MIRSPGLLALLSLVGAGLVSPCIASAGTPPSRQWMQIAERVVADQRPGPPDAARIYAYAATAYRDTLRATGNPLQAGEATRQVLKDLLPDAAPLIDQLAPRQSPIAPSEATELIIADLLARASGDGRGTDDPEGAWAKAPRRLGNWYQEKPRTPLNPSAGSWQRWIDAGAILNVAPPPVFGSGAYTKDLNAVRAAVAARDAQWTRLIAFWSGGPGTATPAGIWQDRLWDETREMPLGSHDRRYADTQAVLAQTIADAAAEAWKVKFTHWTARPTMIDATIATSFANPPFPAYVSGHATMSSAAAEVLSAFVPTKADLWRRDAKIATDSRLFAGVHFPSDNAAGAKLGRAVGREAICRLHLKPHDGSKRRKAPAGRPCP